MQSIAICLLVCALSIAGCATTSKSGGSGHQAGALQRKTVLTTLSSVKSRKAEDLNDNQRRALQTALEDMEDFCTPRLSAMENDASRKAKYAFWLSVAGAVSGAVIAPALTAGNAAANATAIAAFSGFGGATNFLSQSLESTGNSGSADATTRNAIVTAIWQRLGDAFDEQKTIGERLTAIDSAKAACVFYSIQVPSVPSLPATEGEGDGEG